MQIFFPKEEAHEIRATILPEVAKKFIDLGIDVSIEAGLGESVFISDELYAEAGAKNFLQIEVHPLALRT